MRVPDPRWERFGELAEPNRAEVLNGFMAWYTYEPGAELPARPAQPDC